MQIGSSKIIIKPAMFVLLGSVLVGIAAVSVAGWYALGPRPSNGLLDPKRWTFSTTSGAKATIVMNSPAAQKELVPVRDGYSNMNMSEGGFDLNIDKTGGRSDTVSIRNVIAFEKKKSTGDMKFSFQGSAPQAFPVTFVIRDSQTKTGGGVVWSHSFNVQGDWKDYTATVPLNNLNKAHMQFMVVAGHLGGPRGDVSLRSINLQ